jgi:zinc D-Ala-D-Ala dipeptidase
MNKQSIYQKLAADAVSYEELRRVPVTPCKETLVKIPQTPNLYSKQFGDDMLPITGNVVYVRQNAARRLVTASKLLATQDPRLSLQVVYGYRALSIQQRLYRKFETELSGQFSSTELREAVHRLIASPDVAGHPTGGAVDIQILRDDQPLDFGTKIWDFAPDSFTYSPFVSQLATSNRLMLRDVMMRAGFAPFDGEWWHFSYGDKEWAYYYNLPGAIYDQIEFSR